jgi:DNA-binding CsgD family transcriptional regulator
MDDVSEIDAQKRELVALARLERQTAGQEPPPDPLVHLSRLEHPRPPLARAAVVTADPASSLDVDLTPKQRELLGALLVAPSASAAAATLGMSRSNVYAGLRRIARSAGITDVSDLLRLLRAGRLASALEP